MKICSLQFLNSMGWLSKLLGFGADVAPGLADWALNQYSGLSKSEKQQNEFNAQQAQSARDFSAQQAEVERDWQEEMYSKYNSLQGKVEQARQAGVNPMFAVTGSAVSPMSASSGGASAPAASGSSSRGPSTDMVGSLLGFSKLKAEIDNINAQTRNADAMALNSEIDALTRNDINQANIKQIMANVNNSRIDADMKKAKIKEICQNVLNSKADTKIKIEQLGLMASQIANIDADTRVKVGQLSQIASSIANTDADTHLKQAQIMFIGAQTNNERLMSSLIIEQANLTGAQASEVRAKIDKLYQDFDHNQIMYALEEVVAHSQADSAQRWDASQYPEPTRTIVRILSDITRFMPNFGVTQVVK